MATVKQRFEKLGLAYSNPVLTEFGRRIAIRCHNTGYPNIKKVEQVEDGVIYIVNDYPDELVEMIDKMILMILAEK